LRLQIQLPDALASGPIQFTPAEKEMAMMLKTMNSTPRAKVRASFEPLEIFPSAEIIEDPRIEKRSALKLKPPVMREPEPEPVARVAAPVKKLFYKIHEVAEITGLKAHVLRYWETEFRELVPPKDGADQRRYRWADIEVVLAIRKLLYEERFTIEGARKRLRDELRQQREPAAAKSAVKAKQSGMHAGMRKDAVSRKIDRSIKILRSDVRELIKMLGA
jgi:DNA-binding transcriptional MerR regulator